MKTLQRLVQRLNKKWTRWVDPYRPELHYMRGPGPKWCLKHGISPPQVLRYSASGFIRKFL
jgi:hypothetical protein